MLLNQFSHPGGGSGGISCWTFHPRSVAGKDFEDKSAHPSVEKTWKKHITCICIQVYTYILFLTLAKLVNSWIYIYTL